MKMKMKNILFTIIIWFLIIAYAEYANATTYYVDIVTGNDSNNGTSIATAWAHLPGTIGVSSGSGWVTIVNGDVVYVKGGSVNNFQVKFLSAAYVGNMAYDSIKIMSGHLAP